MLTFKQFLKDELNTAQKLSVLSWGGHTTGEDENGLNRIYSEKAENISGHIIPKGKNYIIIPGVASVLNQVKGHLENNGYKMLDYDKGTASDHLGRIVNIGKVLSKTNADQKLIDDFSNDDRKNAHLIENNDIVISRNPYHVAECSTNKKWKSCSSLTSTGTFARTGGGEGAKKLKDEIKAGTHIAYLIPKIKDGENDNIDRRIDNALSRVLLKPYISLQSNHVVLKPENKVYSSSKTSAKNVGFLRCLEDFTNTNFPMNSGEVYQKDTSVYNDDKNQIAFNNSPESLDTIIKSSSGDARTKGIIKILDDPTISSDQTMGIIHSMIKLPRIDRNLLDGIAIHPKIKNSHMKVLLNTGNPGIICRFFNRIKSASEKTKYLHAGLNNISDPRDFLGFLSQSRRYMDDSHITPIINKFIDLHKKLPTENEENMLKYKKGVFSQIYDMIKWDHGLDDKHLNILKSAKNAYINSII